ELPERPVRLAPIAALSLLLLACSRGDAASGAPTAGVYESGLLAAGTPAPDVTLYDLDGKAFPLSSLRGKTVLLHFWFRNCPYCQSEMPQLSTLWGELSAKRPDVEFLSVNANDTPEVIRAWWRDGSFQHRAVRQKGTEVSAAFGVQSYPTNYVIGPDGKV